MSQHEFVRAQDERIGALVREWSQKEQTVRDLAALQRESIDDTPKAADTPPAAPKRSWFERFIDRFF